MATTLRPVRTAHNGSVGGTTAGPTLAARPAPTRPPPARGGGSITGVHEDLAACLRAWRSRLDPEDVGLPRSGSRRAPGLRREEVAARAGISVNYLVRLEQGRAQAPSASVVAALARALRLPGDEAEHLHLLAGLAAPLGRTANRTMSPSLRRLVERFDDVPLIVVDVAWDVVAANEMATAFLSEDDPVGQNAACRQFLGAPWGERAPADDAAFERDLVGELHRQRVRHPGDERLRAVVAQLRTGSPRFAALWEQRPAGVHTVSRKTFAHPDVGRVTVDCDVLEARGTDLRVVVWTAAPGTPDGDAMARLRPARQRAVATP
ncbi:helix-turn-helix transcriptional regulator [Pseudokineococcus marinus]|uniref:Helix-turn-helix domain-containing protein n=1 Tax=Pseudokineococcus marinus TaxID=351215 RepID=A0A849BJN1_9ACTN|nr:helix-turn-helix transcriptional regulator [Pseudokineococcus marinus]NNH23459.1 helix-turn-helix domain-containing protein [Pseudokineococcus marinus]